LWKNKLINHDRGEIMKKLISYVMIMFLCFSAVSCNGNNEQEERGEEEERFDIKIATNILNTYMEYLSNGNIENAKKLFSEEISDDLKGIYDTDLKVEGFKLEEISEVGKSGLFTVRVTRAAEDKPMTVLDEFNIKVEMEDNEYKISEIKSMTEKEAFLENGGLRLRQRNDVMTNLIIDLGGVPQYTYPKDDKANINKARVPRDNFGVMNFSYTGDRIAISTFAEDAFVGIIKIDDSMPTQGAGGGAGGGGTGAEGAAGGEQQQQPGGGSGIPAKEQPVGQEITTIDLIKAAKIELLAFSLDEKFLVVQYQRPQIGRTLRVYDSEGGDILDIRFEDEYPMDKVDVVFSSFDEDVLNFEVRQKENTERAQGQLLGKWQLDLKEEEIKKL
jgi:hypothetical protein